MWPPTRYRFPFVPPSPSTLSPRNPHQLPRKALPNPDSPTLVTLVTSLVLLCPLWATTSVTEHTASCPHPTVTLWVTPAPSGPSWLCHPLMELQATGVEGLTQPSSCVGQPPESPKASSKSSLNSHILPNWNQESEPHICCLIPKLLPPEICPTLGARALREAEGTFWPLWKAPLPVSLEKKAFFCSSSHPP